MIVYRRMHLTPEKFRWLWDQMAALKQRTMFDDSATPEVFFAALSAPDAIHFDVFEGTKQVGVASIMGINGWSGIVHATYFDKRVRGREQPTRQLLQHVMRELNLLVLHAYTPMTHKASLVWIPRLGFSYDGVIRRAAIRGGIAIDNAVFSLLRETVEADNYVTLQHNAAKPAAAETLPARTGVAGDTLPLRPQLAPARTANLPTVSSRWREAVSYARAFFGRSVRSRPQRA